MRLRRITGCRHESLRQAIRIVVPAATPQMAPAAVFTGATAPVRHQKHTGTPASRLLFASLTSAEMVAAVELSDGIVGEFVRRVRVFLVLATVMAVFPETVPLVAVTVMVAPAAAVPTASVAFAVPVASVVPWVAVTAPPLGVEADHRTADSCVSGILRNDGNVGPARAIRRMLAGRRSRQYWLRRRPVVLVPVHCRRRSCHRTRQATSKRRPKLLQRKTYACPTQCLEPTGRPTDQYTLTPSRTIFGVTKISNSSLLFGLAAGL